VIPDWRPYEHESELLAALGVQRSFLPVEAYPNGPFHVYVELDSEEAVAALRPNFAALTELGEVAANCFAGAGRSWKTRMFAPAGVKGAKTLICPERRPWVGSGSIARCSPSST
jgi:trans-2,3-dihydro-3-hydroxyanthranilate isomerase